MQVELLHITPVEIVTEAYADCYGGRGKRKVNVEDIPGHIAKGHLSPLRQAHATFNVTGISRACLAQLVRHNFLALSVESQRRVAPTGFVCPQTINSSGFWLRYDALLQHALALYEDMVAGGVPREDARYALSLATETFLKITTNFEQWRWLIQIRALNPAAQWEIRDLCGKILDILKVEAPHVFGDL